MIDPYDLRQRAQSLAVAAQPAQFSGVLPAGDPGGLLEPDAAGFLEDLWIEVIRRAVRKRRCRQARDVSHRGAGARQNRRLHGRGQGEKLAVDISKIESTLRDNDVEVGLDSFVDESKLRQVIGVDQDALCRGGLQRRRRDHQPTELPGGPKLVAPDVQHRLRSEGRNRRDSLRRQRGVRRRHAAEADEGATRRRTSGCRSSATRPIK